MEMRNALCLIAASSRHDSGEDLIGLRGQNVGVLQIWAILVSKEKKKSRRRKKKKKGIKKKKKKSSQSPRRWIQWSQEKHAWGWHLRGCLSRYSAEGWSGHSIAHEAGQVPRWWQPPFFCCCNYQSLNKVCSQKKKKRKEEEKGRGRANLSRSGNEPALSSAEGLKCLFFAWIWHFWWAPHYCDEEFWFWFWFWRWRDNYQVLNPVLSCGLQRKPLGLDGLPSLVVLLDDSFIHMRTGIKSKNSRSEVWGVANGWPWLWEHSWQQDQQPDAQKHHLPPLQARLQAAPSTEPGKQKGERRNEWIKLSWKVREEKKKKKKTIKQLNVINITCVDVAPFKGCRVCGGGARVMWKRPGDKEANRIWLNWALDILSFSLRTQ